MPFKKIKPGGQSLSRRHCASGGKGTGLVRCPPPLGEPLVREPPGPRVELDGFAITLPIPQSARARGSSQPRSDQNRGLRGQITFGAPSHGTRKSWGQNYLQSELKAFICNSRPIVISLAHRNDRAESPMQFIESRRGHRFNTACTLT